MPHRSVVGLALAGLALTCLPALADPPVTDGLICSFATVIDPTAEEGTQTGQLQGGPVHFGEQPDGVNADQGTLICRVQVIDAFTSDHNGTGPSVSGHTNAAGVATAGPNIATINRTGTQNVFLCSEFVDDSDGTTYYWDDDENEWSTSPYVHCGLAIGGDDGGDQSGPPIACPIFAQLPTPLAEALQEAWGDCAESGPNSAVVVHNVPGTNSAVLVTPPLWSCSQPSGLVGTSGSVTCSPPGLNSLTNCKEVFNTAIALPDPLLPPPPAATITGTTECNSALTVSATASSSAQPIISLQSEVGLGTMPITCSWNASVPAPLGWGVICAWNLLLTDDDSISPPENDPVTVIPCEAFSLLPSPLAELAQALWGGCDEAGPPSTIGIQSIPGTNTAVLVTPPGWTCDMSTGSIVGPSGTVTCTDPFEPTSLENAHLANTRTRCLSVKAEAHLAPDGNATVSYTSTCGNLSTTATAGPVVPQAESTATGSANRPVTCTWNVTGNPVTWGGTCETNRG